MKVKLTDANKRPLYEQEVIFAGRLPDLIRWRGLTFAHVFTHWPHGITSYQQITVFEMPEPLLPGVSTCPLSE